MSISLVTAPAVMAFVAFPMQVIWAYSAFAAVLAIGLIVIFLRGDWQQARGLDKLILLAPLFYAAPLVAFGGQHFTLNKVIASLIPAWIPWHVFFAYFVGTCFIAAGLSMVTRVQTRVAASLVGLTFFLFVLLMDIPGWARNPHNRFAMALALRELSFSGGALALAASMSLKECERSARVLATVARYFIAGALLVYGIEQFLHGDHVPGVPLVKVTPLWLFGHSLWTYLVAAVYVIAGPLLLAGKKTRAAATWAGMAVLLVILVVYIPIAVAERTLLEGFNYLADTLMFGGAVLLLAGAMPRESVAAARADARDLAPTEAS